MKIRYTLSILVVFLWSEAICCKYTIREIGYSTLNRVTYALYRINANDDIFPTQEKKMYEEANIKTFSLNSSKEVNNEIVQFVNDSKIAFPAYVLVDPDNRKLAMRATEFKNTSLRFGLKSDLQQSLLKDLPDQYATVLLIEGKDPQQNLKAASIINQACSRIEGVLPNMPKLVKKGPTTRIVTNSDFEKEKILMWSLGLEIVPEQPTAFILYGRGRIMGEVIKYDAIEKGDVYKLLSIIGADCECGLDRKWMLGYQVPLNWPKETRQNLTDDLGFDVDNPMVLAEMSRILAIENRLPQDPSAITFEPRVINLDEEFEDVPEIEYSYQTDKEEGGNSYTIILMTCAGLLLLVLIGVFFLMRRKV